MSNDIFSACLVSYATETVMQLCHGKRSCELSADTGTFGSPCRPESRMYLKVVYTCGKVPNRTQFLDNYKRRFTVPRKVLKEEYEGQLEPDEAESNTHLVDDEDDFETYDAGNEYIRESAASPPAPKVNSESKSNLTKDLANNNSKSATNFNKGQGFGMYPVFFIIVYALVTCDDRIKFAMSRILINKFKYIFLEQVTQ